MAARERPRQEEPNKSSENTQPAGELTMHKPGKRRKDNDEKSWEKKKKTEHPPQEESEEEDDDTTNHVPDDPYYPWDYEEWYNDFHGISHMGQQGKLGADTKQTNSPKSQTPATYVLWNPFEKHIVLLHCTVLYDTMNINT
uniref:Uncharacterized protein n=1 Tax=Psilocybe cubensis TaxID=181762 RepID=A0A8H7XZN3_PSICU